MLFPLALATAIAVWDGDFTRQEIGGVKLELNNCSVSSGGAWVDIDSSGGIRADGIDVSGLKTSSITVIAGYSGYTPYDGSHAMFTIWTEGGSAFIWDGEGAHEAASGLHYFAFVASESGTRGCRVYGCSKDGWRLVESYGTTFKSNGDFTRIRVGTGMSIKLKRLAVIDEALELKKVIGYPWPNPEKVRAVVSPRRADLDGWARSNAEFGKAVVNDLVAHSGSEIEWVDDDATNFCESADVLASVFRIPEYENDYLFPTRPLSRMHYGVYAPRGREERKSLHYYMALKKLKVGWSPVSQGTPDDRERFFAQNGMKPEYVEYAKSEDAVAALSAGEVDLLFLYTAQNSAPPDADELVPVGDRLVFFAVKRNRPELYTAICDEFDALLTYRSDVVDRLVNQFFGSHLAFTPEEVAWMHDMSEHGEKIMVDISPLHYSGTRRPTPGMQGFAGQLFSEIGELTGLKFGAPLSTGVDEAKVKFARGETPLWAPYPVKPAEIPGAEVVFEIDFPDGSYPVVANSTCPELLKSILYKAAHSISQKRITELYLNVLGEREHERQIEIEVSGQYKRRLVSYAAIALTVTLVLALGMILALVFALVKSRRAREASELASKAKGRFLSSMSHELRTPLNAILGFADLASRHTDDGAYVRGNLQKISTAGSHLLSIINDVLDVSRVEQGRFKIDRAEARLGDIIDEIVDLVGSSIAAKGLEFFLDAASVADDVIEIDRVRLKQVLLNLLGNAIKFTKSGSITLRAKRADGCYRFEVTDTGCGISKEFLPKVFAPFEREDSEATKGVQGTGLGLAITSQIVELVGGTIACASEQGKGSTFTITFPREKLREQPKGGAATCCRGLVIPPDGAAATTSAREQELKGMKILVAEDNELNRIVIEGFLSEAGASVEFAVNGAEAVERVAGTKPGDFAVVLMDIQMPVMDGYAAAKAIRALPGEFARKVPILAVSADAFDEDRAKARVAGMNGHVAKPIAPEALYAAIAAVTGEKKK